MTLTRVGIIVSTVIIMSVLVLGSASAGKKTTVDVQKDAPIQAPVEPVPLGISSPH